MTTIPRRPWLYAATASAVLGCLAAAPLHAQQLGPIREVTRLSPYAGCTADRVPMQVRETKGRLYPNTEIEPWVAIDPTDPNRIVVVTQQDRWSNGGSRGVRSAISQDGGTNWAIGIQSGVTQCQGGRFPRSSDPWVTFAPNGVAFFFSLAFYNDRPPHICGETAMVVNRSNDGGRTWGPPVNLIDDTAADLSNDKNAMTADPNNASFVYSSWDRLQGTNICASAQDNGDAATQAIGHDGVARARQRLAERRARLAAGLADTQPVTFGPTLFARTTDGGRTWDKAVTIYDPGPNAQTLNNIPVVTPNGDVLVFFTNIAADGSLKIGFVKSTDHGASFSAPAFATDIIGNQTVTPNGGNPIRDGYTLYAVSVDPKTGALYLAWQDNRFSTTNPMVDGVAFAQSTDGGASWSTPVQINRTPQDPAHPLLGQAFIPAIVAAEDGTVAVTYYDFRNDSAAAATDATDYFALFCKPGADCTKPTGWGSERRLTIRSFDMNEAPLAGIGIFLGDYMALGASGSVVRPVWGEAVAPNRTNLYSRPITLGMPVALQAPTD